MNHVFKSINRAYDWMSAKTKWWIYPLFILFFLWPIVLMGLFFGDHEPVLVKIIFAGLQTGWWTLIFFSRRQLDHDNLFGSMGKERLIV